MSTLPSVGCVWGCAMDGWMDSDGQALQKQETETGRTDLTCGPMTVFS